MVDREGAVQENNMLTIHSITTQLQSQSINESQAILNNSSQDENAAKIRHHSEPHPPTSILSGANKKLKIITFQEGVTKDSGATLASILLTAEANTSASWDSANSNPPNKRQCRSMSIPNDGELRTHWLQSQAQNRLHRPLAVRPGSGSSRSKIQPRNSQGRSLLPVWPSISHSDTHTPPESPRSRPSSASSGFFDSPLASLSNLSRNRCESLQTLPSAEHASRHTSGDYDASSSIRVILAKSMPSVADPLSSHISPSKQQLLRCQSQPCVIHERRGGVKRRRNEEHRPSINFNKMTETAFGKVVNELSAVNRLSSPLKIRPTARYGQRFPDRVLQTIASSPQDTNYISALTSSTSSCISPPTAAALTHSPIISKLSCSSISALPPPLLICNTADPVATDEDSDSGCSTTDEELCDITNKMVTVDDSNGKLVCDHKTSPTSASSGCVCLCPGESEHDFMFAMESNQDSELDIDMIENN